MRRDRSGLDHGRPAVLSVYPGQEATGTVQAAPPQLPSSVAGVTPFRLIATSAVHANISSSAAGRVDVAPYHELAAALVPTSSHGRGLTRHQITLDNRGNVPLRIGLHAIDVADGLRLGFPAFADVPPGGSWRCRSRCTDRAAGSAVRRPRPSRSSRRRRAAGGDVPGGTRTVIPPFPAWAPRSPSAVVAAAVAGAVTRPKLIGHPQPITSYSTTPGNRRFHDAG